jgi:hypothetical protein
VHLPDWVIQILVLSTYLHATQVLMGTSGMCTESTIPDWTDSPLLVFETIRSYASFGACIDPDNTTEDLIRFALFTIGTLPFLLILAAFLFDLFNNAVTGTVVAALTIATGLVLLFS